MDISPEKQATYDLLQRRSEVQPLHQDIQDHIEDIVSSLSSEQFQNFYYYIEELHNLVKTDKEWTLALEKLREGINKAQRES